MEDPLPPPTLPQQPYEPQLDTNMMIEHKCGCLTMRTGPYMGKLYSALSTNAATTIPVPRICRATEAGAAWVQHWGMCT